MELKPRIIKHGKNFWREADCPACGCRFRYLLGEVATISEAIYDSPYRDQIAMWKNRKVILCPDCKSKVYLKEEE